MFSVYSTVQYKKTSIRKTCFRSLHKSEEVVNSAVVCNLDLMFIVEAHHVIT